MFAKITNCSLASVVKLPKKYQRTVWRRFLHFASNNSVLELGFCSMTYTLRLKGEIGYITERRQCQKGDSRWCDGMEDRNKSKRSRRTARKAKQCTIMSATFCCVSEVILSSVVPKLCSIQQLGVIDHTVMSRGNQFESRLRYLLAIAIDNCLLVSRAV